MDFAKYLEIDKENGCVYSCINHIMFTHSDGIGFDTYHEKINQKPIGAKTYLLKIPENDKTTFNKNTSNKTNLF